MKASLRASIQALLRLALPWAVVGCAEPPEDTKWARAVIGPDGGVLTSLDGVLTLAIPPGALDRETEIFIGSTKEPPDVFGDAYLVRPNPMLRYDVSVTYRHELPEDASGLAVGAIDADEFADGRGRWIALPVLRLDREAELISGLDPRLSIFYALLDEDDVGPTD